MRYFLIKDCRIAGQSDKKRDILIANDKIIAIGNGLARPTIDTEEIDANENLVIPGLVKIDSHFTEINSRDEMMSAVEEDIRTGHTTWIAPAPTADMADMLTKYAFQMVSTLNYSLQFSVDHFKHGDLNKIRTMASLNGMPTMHYTLVTPQAADNERLEMYIDTADKNGLAIMIEVVKGCENADTHLSALDSICRKLDNTQCRVFFINIRYKEEIEIFNRLRETNKNITAQICFNPMQTGNGGLSEFSAEEFMNLLRRNDWLCGNVVVPDMPMPKGEVKVEEGEVIGDFVTKTGMTEVEASEYFTTRPCRILGMTPEKGQIKVGSDADLCIIDNSKPRGQNIMAVIMSGRAVFRDNEIIRNNIKGQQAFRRFV